MTNRRHRWIAAAASVALAGIFSVAATAQQSASLKTGYAAVDVLPLTCAQAWVKSGKSYPKMLAIVKTLAAVSLTNRGLAFPDTRAAGMEAGKGIAGDCKADPNGLLFAIVDKHVRQVAEARASE